MDGARVHLAAFGGDEDFKASLKNPTLAGDDVEARARVRVPLTAGPHTIGVAFIEKTAAQNSWRLQPFLRSSHDTFDPTGYPHLDVVLDHRAVQPDRARATRRAAARSSRAVPRRRRRKSRARAGSSRRSLVAPIAARPPTRIMQRLMSFYAAGRREGTFEKGIQLALQRMLASAKFVLRIERDPAGVAPGSVYRLNNLDLASRLSFFLWSSIPDDELLRVAEQGRLRTPAVLRQQVRRMLADPKSEALVTNFAGQWLYLRNLKNMVPLSTEFVDFDDNLRRAFERETELFFESIMRENRNVLDLMNADYTFVNERLAKHYGIPGVYGSHFRRVTLADEARRGLLGKGAILMVTSHTDRTSPVVRGKWVLDNLLGAPPPPMPANVPPLDENAQQAGRVLTMRERMEVHRAESGVRQLPQDHGPDRPGDGELRRRGSVAHPRRRNARHRDRRVGRAARRHEGRRRRVAAPGAHAQPGDLRRHLRREADDLCARPRRLRPTDMPTVRQIVRDGARQNYRFASIVEGIVQQPAVSDAARAGAAGAGSRRRGQLR